jgi:excisionase family DNA binding protein
MEFPSIDAGAKLAKRELETFLSDDPALIERRASFWQDPPSDTPTLSRFLSGPPRFSIFCPWTPIQKCAELARLARKLEEPDDDELVAPLPVPTPPQPVPVPVPAHADGLQTKSQAARRLNISIRTLRGLIKSGELRYVNLGHGKQREKIMFTDSYLDDLIASRTRQKVQECPSTSPKARRTTTSTSSGEVLAFTARRNGRTGAKRKR